MLCVWLALGDSRQGVTCIPSARNTLHAGRISSTQATGLKILRHSVILFLTSGRNASSLLLGVSERGLFHNQHISASQTAKTSPHSTYCYDYVRTAVNLTQDEKVGRCLSCARTTIHQTDRIHPEQTPWRVTHVISTLGQLFYWFHISAEALLLFR